MKQQYMKNVVNLALNESACIGCGMCLNVCPHAVFTLEKNDAGKQLAHIQNKDACMACGACAMNCPVDALSVDKGVGCAYAIIMGKLLGTEPTCGCDSGTETNSDSGCC